MSDVAMPLIEVLTIPNKKGLHARAAAKFVNIVNAHDVEVRVTRVSGTPPMFEEGEEFWVASGGSVLGILTLGAEMGTKIRIEAYGNDAQTALEALKDLIERKFDEE